MNIVEAVGIVEHSPSVIAQKLKSFIYGFKNKRKVTYFDLFLFYPLYSYKPANSYFDKAMRLDNNMNFFITHSSLSPEIFVNVHKDYLLTISLIKEAILYGVNNKYFNIDESFFVKLTKKTIRNEEKDLIAENIGKFYSCQNTAYLYDFFKVDIDAI